MLSDNLLYGGMIRGPEGPWGLIQCSSYDGGKKMKYSYYADNRCGSPYYKNMIMADADFIKNKLKIENSIGCLFSLF